MFLLWLYAALLVQRHLHPIQRQWLPFCRQGCDFCPEMPLRQHQKDQDFLERFYAIHGSFGSAAS